MVNILTKTQAKVLQAFTGKITRAFSIREIARILKMHVSLAHRAIKPLIGRKVLVRDGHKLLSLNYSKNQGIICYAEYLKREEFLDKNKEIAMFAEEVADKISEDCFSLVLFGSAVVSAKPRDIDILLIVNKTEKAEDYETLLKNIADHYSIPLEVRAIGLESAYEMLAKQNEANLMNEILNKHIILYGAELFYRIIKKGRK